jgi:dihydrofolate synthase/folylpolyglutamate synthase
MVATYREALAYIYSFVDYEARGPGGYAPDLRRVMRLLDLLGNPHRNFPAMLIAGTKGKGSTAAMAESILRVAGYHTGLYTSPHLHTFRERIRVVGEMISAAEVASLVEELRPAIEATPGATPFEIITALAFVCFARAGIEVAVLEVGLGGRLDASNVVEPAVAVLTSISYDHTQVLGNTLSLIAREKAGIVKPGILVVSSPQVSEVMEVIEEVCRERQAWLALVGRDWTWQAGPQDWEGQSFSTRQETQGAAFNQQPTADIQFSDLWIPLLGRHQLVNAVTAIAAVHYMARADIRASPEAIRIGLRNVRWPGRLEILSRRPLVVVDSAHNTDSAEKLRAALADLFPANQPILIFGASSDKDIGGMLEVLLPVARRVIATRSRHLRAASPEQVCELARGQGYGIEIRKDVPAALERALELAGPDGLICVTGSIFVVADAREAWAERTGGPMPDRDPEL